MSTCIDIYKSTRAAWPGTGTVDVVLPDRCCRPMGLPRCRVLAIPKGFTYHAAILLAWWH